LRLNIPTLLIKLVRNPLDLLGGKLDVRLTLRRYWGFLPLWWVTRGKSRVQFLDSIFPFAGLQSLAPGAHRIPPRIPPSNSV